MLFVLHLGMFIISLIFTLITKVDIYNLLYNYTSPGSYRTILSLVLLILILAIPTILPKFNRIIIKILFVPLNYITALYLYAAIFGTMSY